jgi:hypothetical protein
MLLRGFPKVKKVSASEMRAGGWHNERENSRISEVGVGMPLRPLHKYVGFSSQYAVNRNRPTGKDRIGTQFARGTLTQLSITISKSESRRDNVTH